MFTVPGKLSGENNKDFSYRVLKDAIMSLELKPGQTISEVEVAETLKISRTPIREVMAKLREEYLVEVRPQVGTYVSKINPQLIEEAAFMRFTLEKEVLRLCCKHFQEEELFELKKIVSLQEKIIDGDAWYFHKLDTRFHQAIFSGNRKENVWQAIARISTHYNRVRLLSEIEHRFENSIQEHKEMIELIENRKVDQVDELAYRHILEPTIKWGNLYKKDSLYHNYFDFTTYKMPVF